MTVSILVLGANYLRASIIRSYGIDFDYASHRGINWGYIVRELHDGFDQRIRESSSSILRQGSLRRNNSLLIPRC